MNELLPNSRNHDKTRDRWSDLNSQNCTVVYFLAIDWHGERPLVKIGYSSKFGGRLASHTTPKHGKTTDVDVLCVVRGSRSDEKAIQRFFGEWRVDGQETELFTPASQLVGYIRWLRNQWCAWVPDDESFAAGGDTPAADYSLWCPGPGRELHQSESRSLFGVDPLWMPRRELTGDDFYTNQIIIEAARSVMGRIDLDPASHAIANQVVKAEQIFTISDDGLSRDWSGTVWCNPPFSKWSEFAPKIEREWLSGRIDAMCVLAAMRTVTSIQFRPVRRSCDAVCVTDGRIPFWGPKAGQPDDGHAIFYFGDNTCEFLNHFSSIGTVFVSTNNYAGVSA